MAKDYRLSLGILNDKQMRLIALLATGGVDNVSQACRLLSIDTRTYTRWIRKPQIAERVRSLQEKKMEAIDPGTIGSPKRRMPPVDQKMRKRALADFEYFRYYLLGRKRVACQARWARWIMQEDRTVILCPRRHGKTTTVRDYVVWRIIRDRNIRVVVISKNERGARRWIKSIKAILGSNPKIINYFGIFKPPGKPEKWTQSELVVEGADPEAEDPTLVSLGTAASMDGLRADLIVVDDPVNVESSSNEEQRQKSEEVVLGSVDNILDNTLDRKPKMVVIGTRKHVLDLYNTLMRTLGFTVHVEKAVLSFEGQHGKLLCPELYNGQGGISFFRKQRDKGLKRFNREFQNVPFDDTDVIVPTDAFEDGANLDEQRRYGHRMPQWYVMINVDPGTTEKGKGSFCVSATAVDISEPHKRYLIDYFEGIIPSEDQPLFLCSWYYHLGAGAMRIESNACQKYLMDAVRREAKFGSVYRGEVFPPMHVNVHPHYTSATKLNDPKAGLEVVGHKFEQGNWSLPFARLTDREKTQEFIDKICSCTFLEHKRAHLLMTLWFGENEVLYRQGHRPRTIAIERPDYLQLVGAA